LIRRVRYFIFLRDIASLAVTCFGGPHAHLALFTDKLVKKHGYISEKEFLELYALCQILPGPTSTQTLTAIGYKVGGPNLAYLTLLVWILPAVVLMTSAGLLLNVLDRQDLSLDFARFIMPMAVAFIAFAGYTLISSVIRSRFSIAIVFGSAIASYLYPTPFTYPIILVMGGMLTAWRYKQEPREERERVSIQWSNFILWAGVWITIAVLGHYTELKSVKLFENFYRNGSLIFGGGQVLIPYMYSEFVEFKGYLTSAEFLSGYGMVQAVPGPTFSFTAFVGTLSMREYGLGGELLGSLLATAGIFLPGTFLIFFLVRFWDQIKKFRVVKASLNGIHAASAGMVIGATFLLLDAVTTNLVNMSIIFGTLLLLLFTRFPIPVIIIAGLVAGFVF